MHVGLWAASHAATIDGDFVECGVNRGVLSSAIMDYLEWDTVGKHFYLLDTFSGIDERYVSAEDAAGGAFTKNQEAFEKGFYTREAASVRAKLLRVAKLDHHRRSHSRDLAAGWR